MPTKNCESVISLSLLALTSKDFDYTDHKKELFERFSEETSNAKMHILRNDGEYRHLSIRGSGFFWAEMITAPNFLAIHGDMGSYVFSRESNMVEFFNKKYINSHYWAQKCSSHSIDSPEVTEISKHKVVDWSRDFIQNNYAGWDKDDEGDSRYITENERNEILSIVESCTGRTLGHYEYELNELRESIDSDNENYIEFIKYFINSLVCTEHNELTRKTIHFEYSLASILAMVRTYGEYQNQ